MYGRVLVFWWGKVKKREHLEDLDVEGRIILKEIFKKYNGSVWTGFICLSNRQAVGFCQHEMDGRISYNAGNRTSRVTVVTGITWRITSGGGGEAKSTMGIKNINLRKSEVRKIDNVRLAERFFTFFCPYTTQIVVYKIFLFYDFVSLQISNPPKKQFLDIKNIRGTFFLPCHIL